MKPYHTGKTWENLRKPGKTWDLGRFGSNWTWEMAKKQKTWDLGSNRTWEMAKITWENLGLAPSWGVDTLHSVLEHSKSLCFSDFPKKNLYAFQKFQKLYAFGGYYAFQILLCFSLHFHSIFKKFNLCMVFLIQFVGL